ncbi:uncharacterized protein LOC123686177 isoform X1 [Harmonia axyridis]|uniref:uncharacterized protein LOC123686177 isoform X1 n=2 Tax=Harmonia axyridis TaxID=115357 RepID=UPI001E276636|nr:uncharacterized protein LOC123686177 isoform X1 [Harmonia axyridis]
MHWYWITVFFLCNVMGDQRTTSTVAPNWQSSFKSKSDTSNIEKNNNSFHSDLSTPLNTPSITQKYLKNQLQNASVDRDSLLQISINSNNSKDNILEETSVINENITNKFMKMSDNQVNASFLTDFNSTDMNMTYFENVTKYEKNWLLNSEQISIAQKDGITDKMSTMEIIGIFLCCVFLVAIFCSIGYFLYNNRGFNRAEVLNDHCSNPDSSGYLDDTSVRDNSEEMYSLDNDSFLNSLEAMTIQNYWTDTVKHTKL